MLSEMPIRIEKNYGTVGNGNNGGLKPIANLTFSSRIMVKDLIEKNLSYDKSMKEKPYLKLNDNLKKYYILGIFDGDGCFSYTKKTKEWSIYSSDIMCNFIEDHLSKELSITFNKRTFDHRNKNLNRTRTCSKENIRKIFNYLYSEKTVYLDRKYELAKKFMRDNNFEII